MALPSQPLPTIGVANSTEDAKIRAALLELQTIISSLDGTNVSTAFISTFARTLLDDTTAAAFLTTLGISAYHQTLLDDTTAGATLTTLGISAFIQTLLDDADASTARGTLGLGALATLAAVNTAQINDGQVTPAKRSAAVQASSVASGTLMTPADTSWQSPVTVGLTGNGRPMLVNWHVVAGSVNTGAVRQANGRLLVNGAVWGVAKTVDLGTAGGNDRKILSGTAIGTPAAGVAQTYAINLSAGAGTTVAFYDGEITVVEL